MLTLVYLILVIIALVAWVITLLVGTGAIAFFVARVPYAPTPKRNVEKIIDLLELKPGQKFYDLGCGDGRFIQAAAKRGAQAVGFEIAPWPFIKAKVRLWLSGSPATIYYRNFYHADLSDADAVYCFLLNSVMAKVEKKLAADLKPGAKLLSYGFILPNTKPTRLITLHTGKRANHLYYYRY